MEKYNYSEAVKNDIISYIKENKINFYRLAQDEDYKTRIYEDLWTTDEVTGNGSGSYTLNTWQAEENICHNLDLLEEAYEEFGYSGKDFTNAESADVTIRCYILSGCLDEAINQLLNEEAEKKDNLVVDLNGLVDYPENTFTVTTNYNLLSVTSRQAMTTNDIMTVKTLIQANFDIIEVLVSSDSDCILKFIAAINR